MRVVRCHVRSPCYCSPWHLPRSRLQIRGKPANGSGETSFLGWVLIWGVCGWVETGSICLRVRADRRYREDGLGRVGVPRCRPCHGSPGASADFPDVVRVIAPIEPRHCLGPHQVAAAAAVAPVYEPSCPRTATARRRGCS